jgi:hypothetical protein
MFCRSFGCPYRAEVIKWLIDSYYRKENRPLRRCHPRDLLLLVRNLCVYRRAPLDLRQEHFAKVVKTYFTLAGQHKADSSSRQISPSDEAVPDSRPIPRDDTAGKQE